MHSIIVIDYFRMEYYKTTGEHAEATVLMLSI